MKKLISLTILLVAFSSILHPEDIDIYHDPCYDVYHPSVLPHRDYCAVEYSLYAFHDVEEPYVDSIVVVNREDGDTIFISNDQPRDIIYLPPMRRGYYYIYIHTGECHVRATFAKWYCPGDPRPSDTEHIQLDEDKQKAANKILLDGQLLISQKENVFDAAGRKVK